MRWRGAPLSLRRYLLVGILLPIALFMAYDTIWLYRQALGAVNTAYDRTLLASAKTIGELLEVEGEGPDARFRSRVPYSALETFEADNRSRMVYRVSDAQGRLVDGWETLAPWRGRIPDKGPYAALVDFYDADLQGDPVRVAVLLQPVASAEGRGMATIQVAETLELRHTLARQLLVDTLVRQALLATVIALVVTLVVQRATRPVRSISALLSARAEGELTPLSAEGLPRELQPLLEATNQVMARLQSLLDHQKRFVRDAAHQLRTPLAVLKVQVQSARRGDVEPVQALEEMAHTVERATSLANQMLALAKVEQLRQEPGNAACDLADVVRGVALDLSPLVAERDLDFEIRTVPATVRSHEWMLRELSRNLLHNAIKHSPVGGPSDGAHGGRRAPRGHDGGRQRCGPVRGTAPAPVPPLLRRPHPQRLGAGPVHLPGDRGGAGRHCGVGKPHRTRADRGAGCHGAPAPGSESGVMDSTDPLHGDGRLRIDKWLWAARFFKTRSLAVEAIHKGQVQVNGAAAKASREVHAGDTVAFRQNGLTRTVAVLGVSAQRGPAPVAQRLYAETEDSQRQRALATEQRRMGVEPALSRQQGRPDKHARRAIEHAWDDRWSASAD
jgi:two-component system sensor histidine kinase TctE